MNTEAFGMSWTMEPPTQPGTYWFRRDPPSRDMLEGREKRGKACGLVPAHVPTVDLFTWASWQSAACWAFLGSRPEIR